MHTDAFVTAGRRRIGAAEPCYVIAEAGSNHNGSLPNALALIDAAAAAGADAVKFQVFRAQKMYAKAAGISRYLGVPQSIYSVIEAMEMPHEWLPTLAYRCREKAVDFIATPFDEASADLLEPHIPIYKIASYELTHTPLLEHIAAKGKPIILSTGTADMAEVTEAVDLLTSRRIQLALMQCTAAYPAPLDSLNVSALVTLKAAFGCPTGLSDHSRDPVLAPVLAIGLGANLIEKHFTFSNLLPGPDHRFAVEPAELRQMVTAIRAAEAARGNGTKEMHPVEHELHQFARRSIFALANIGAGEELTPVNIGVLRCGELPYGLHPRDFNQVLGRRAGRPIGEGSPIVPDALA